MAASAKGKESGLGECPRWLMEMGHEWGRGAEPGLSGATACGERRQRANHSAVSMVSKSPEHHISGP